jgi:hypothetical protein
MRDGMGGDNGGIDDGAVDDDIIGVEVENWGRVLYYCYVGQKPN